MSLAPDEYVAHCLQACEKYVNAVLAGALVVGKLERLAVERFARDLDSGRFEFKIEQVERVLQKFSRYRHSKGKQWSRRQFVLSDWEVFILCNLFGFYKPDGTRRFRMAYIQIARKNGKTTFAAGIAIYLTADDDEPGAEVYAAATKRDQAKIVHEEARRMVLQSPELRAAMGTHRNAITCPDTWSSFVPLGADADTMDGLNPHGCIVDELHAHKTRAVWDVLDTGTGARTQPMQVGITTAGSEQESVCREQRDYSEKLLEGSIDPPDDGYFAFVCEPDEGDDWLDETTWRKGNPNLGISIQIDELREKARRAAQSPGAQNEFRRKRLDEWTQQETRWIDMVAWNALPATRLALGGRKCFGGLDLASTSDLCAFLLLFPPTDSELWAVLPWFWMPESAVDRAVKQHRIPYDAWVRDGWIKTTQGTRTDYDVVRADVGELGSVYRIGEIGYDPYNSQQIVTQLTEDGFLMVETRQGRVTMNGPMKAVDDLIAEGKLNVGPNPVLRWMASNVQADVDHSGLMKPSRQNRTMKIDGIAALLTAMARVLGAEPEQDGPSAYEGRGLLSIRM